MGRRVLRALLVTSLVFLACFIAVLGLLVVAGGDLSFGGNRVALVPVEGLIVDAQEVVLELEKHAADPAIRAVVVHVQSPGGVVAPTQEIYDAILRVRAQGKPVVVSMGAVAASGGYYLAAAADHIVANAGTLTGSIGVILQLTELSPLLEKVGIRYEVIKAGRYKDIGHVARTMTDEERAILQELLDDMYDQFVTAVADGRKLEPETVRRLADGRIYSGRRAKELALVDSLGGLEDAVRKAGELAGIPGRPELVRPRRQFRWTDVLRWLGSRTPLGGLVTVPPSVGPWPLLGSTKVPLYLME